MNLLKIPTIIIILIFGFSIGYLSHNFTSGFSIKQTDQSILQSKKIQEAYMYLEKKYYGFHERTPEQREDSMIDALTKSLGDKHTSYFNKKDAQEFSEALSGDFEGIGAIIKEHQKGIQIMKVLKNSPASKKNLQKGDIILAIGKTNTVGMSVGDAVELIRGPKGSTVDLTILSGDNKIQTSIQRDTVMVPSVDSSLLTGTTIGYIELGFFGEHTTDEFSDAISQLTGSGMTGLIIDARNNGGGYLESAVDILSIFLQKNNLVVATRGINPTENIDYMTKKMKIQTLDIPIIMIVNNMSASATEIVAGALQDYDRALIIGEKTYGKGSVQEPFLLSDGSMMKITIAKWFTPKNRGIDEKGITPDIGIELTEEDYKNIYDRQLESAKKLIEYTIKNTILIKDIKKDTDKMNSILNNDKITH